MKVKLIETDSGRFGESVTVYVDGVAVAFLQGVGLSDLKQRKLREWARAAHEGMSVTELQDTVRYGGVCYLNPDDFTKVS